MKRFGNKYVFLLILIIVIAGFEAKYYYSKSHPNTAVQKNYLYSRPIRVGNSYFKVFVANTQEQRVAGLSNTEELKNGQGMLFVFDDPDKYGIWMKDMNYPIDIIWFDLGGKVSYIKKDVPPNTYPEIFHPEAIGTYILEVSAGTVEKNGIKIGDQINY